MFYTYCLLHVSFAKIQLSGYLMFLFQSAYHVKIIFTRTLRATAGMENVHFLPRRDGGCEGEGHGNEAGTLESHLGLLTSEPGARSILVQEKSDKR